MLDVWGSYEKIRRKLIKFDIDNTFLSFPKVPKPSQTTLWPEKPDPPATSKRKLQMDRDEEDLLTLSPKIRKKEDLMHTGPTGNILVSGEAKSPKDCQETLEGRKFPGRKWQPEKGETLYGDYPPPAQGTRKLKRMGEGQLESLQTRPDRKNTFHHFSQHMQNDYMKDSIHCYFLSSYLFGANFFVNNMLIVLSIWPPIHFGWVLIYWFLYNVITIENES